MAAYSFTNSKGRTYYLHSKLVTLRGGRQQQIYFFALDERPDDAVEELPEGYAILENERNKFPTLKKTDKK